MQGGSVALGQNPEVNTVTSSSTIWAAGGGADARPAPPAAGACARAARAALKPTMKSAEVRRSLNMPSCAHTNNKVRGEVEGVAVIEVGG